MELSCENIIGQACGRESPLGAVLDVIANDDDFVVPLVVIAQSSDPSEFDILPNNLSPARYQRYG